MNTFKDDTEGTLADFLTNAVVYADDVVGAGRVRSHNYLLTGTGREGGEKKKTERRDVHSVSHWRGSDGLRGEEWIGQNRT